MNKLPLFVTPTHFKLRLDNYLVGVKLMNKYQVFLFSAFSHNDIRVHILNLN